MNANLEDYHVPVNADIPSIDVSTVEETDTRVNPIGVKGAGEAGAIPVGALFAQALEDALQGSGLEIREIG